MKICFKCRLEKSLGEFYKHPGMKDGYLNKCKDCSKEDSIKNYKNNIEHYRQYEKKRKNLPHRKELSYKILKNWRRNNRGLSKAQLAKYRATKLQRTVKWAKLDKIKKIYLNCPKGHHVDHIVPLQGRYVSGLHVHYNLQYLTKSENSSKGNKFN